MAEKQKMQADGNGKKSDSRMVDGQLASDHGNPEAREARKKRAKESGDFKGGQSNQAYYGKGQLGEKDVGKTQNAPSTED